MGCRSEVKVLPVPGESYKLVTGLLPCPFCGDDNLLLKSMNGGGKTEYFYLSCRVQSCLMGKTRAHRAISKLFRLWNNRISKFATPMVDPPKPRKRSWLKEFFFGGS